MGLSVRVRRSEWCDDCTELQSRDLLPDVVPWAEQDVWTAWAGPTLAAVATGRTSQIDPTYYLLSTCAVDEDFRGRGLQRRMILARVRHARRQGYIYAYSYTWCQNAASLRSLIRCGFLPFQEDRFTEPVGKDYVLLRRKLC